MLSKTVVAVLILDLLHRFSLAQNCDVLPFFLDRMDKCLGKNKVADYGTYKCHSLGLRSGNCESNELLVIDDSSDCNFPVTKCHQFHHPDGSACPRERPLLHEGECRSPSWPCREGSHRHTLQADYFGQVTCQCSAQLGFVEWTDGICYHEYLRGPCVEGEELVRKPFPVNAACLKHGCQEGEVKWPDRKCYRVVGDPLECESKMELAPPEDGRGPSPGPEVVERGTVFHLQCERTQTYSIGSINNCLAEAKDGTCLKRSRKTSQFPRGDLRSIIRQKHGRLSSGKA